MAHSQDMMGGSPPRLFVTGSTGELGRIVVGKLLERVPADSIVAGIRSPDQAVA